MAYLSELIGKPVTDIDGERIGELEDVIASIRGDIPHPMVVAIQVKHANQHLEIPFHQLAVFIAPAIPLNLKRQEIESYHPAETDLYLARDVLDKQIIDTNGVRVVRVNDLELTRVNGSFFVANVDVGSLGLLRRMGLARLAQSLAGRVKKPLSGNEISWDDVELLSDSDSMRLKVPGDRISELHPADLAEIISDLSRAQSDDLLETFDIETLADTLEEVEPDFQASLVKSMPDERVADVLEEMAPDEAADLLAELGKERSEDLLELMEDENAEDVRRLLAYPEDSAGGLMTTEYVTIPENITAQEAIALLRSTASEAETIFYVYVTDEDNCLIGVFSLSDLIMADPETPVKSFMHKRVVSVLTSDSQDDVAQSIAKYDLLAIPVVDENNHLMGIVTSDDALDKIIPTAWKKRLPRYYR
ncbi:MAG: CBS domain-containing protein [Anaerolineaceae bacterium]|nr:CBS domain-containing protein [Anaerolineaceae bacterium]